MSDHCHHCDRPLATNADSLDLALNPDDGDGSEALCWRRWNRWELCMGTPVDWRGRFLATDELLAATLGEQSDLALGLATAEYGLSECREMLEARIRLLSDLYALLFDALAELRRHGHRGPVEERISKSLGHPSDWAIMEHTKGRDR